MKQTILLLVLLAVLTFCLPYAGLLLTPSTTGTTALPPPAASKPAGDSALLPTTTATPPKTTEAPLLILDESTGEVLTVPMREYVLGAVAAEMPPSYPPEALKAQAVAAHSYALALKADANGGDASLQGAYFKANPSQRMGFVTEKVMRSMWGNTYAENRAKLEQAVDAVLSKVLYYDSKPALACYHAISIGKTESSEAVWGSAVPYLVSVESPYDITAPDYGATLRFTSQEMREALQFNLKEVVLEGTPDTWVSNPQQTAAGYIATVQIGTSAYSGQEVRKALGLRSSAFSIAWDGEAKEFVVSTRGYGHGVGLSQYGANAMALTGMTYDSILALYYPGTTLTEAS